MRYPLGSSVIYHSIPCIVEKFVPEKDVPTKCTMQNRGSAYNLYLVRSVTSPNRSIFVWECQLDAENIQGNSKQEVAL
jgi:hypothetical protein